MQDFNAAFATAFNLITSGDDGLFEIILLSLGVTTIATLFACLIGMPLGAALAATRFRGRSAITIFLNALMGVPPVVVGLTVYLLVSATGPFGALDLLYTPSAMVIAQMLLATPIVAALSRQTIADLQGEYDELLRSMGAGRAARLGVLLWDARMSLVTAALAGFGRCLAEVGAVMVVGGNIEHQTRTMTTAIAMEEDTGDIAMALGLGIILVGLSIAVTAALSILRAQMERAAHV